MVRGADIASSSARYTVLFFSEWKTDKVKRCLYYVYSFETGMIKPLPDSLTNHSTVHDQNTIVLDGDDLTMIEMGQFSASKQTVPITLTRYNLATEQIEPTIFTTIGVSTTPPGNPGARTGTDIRNNKMYIYGYKHDKIVVLVMDLTNGNILYKGKVTLANPDHVSSEVMKNLTVDYLTVMDR